MKSAGKKKILLVEDEAIIAMNEKMSLEKYGYEVVTAHTGEKAVKTIKTTSDIDLILMDIDLGSGIDGTETAEIILKEKEIPVVFLSSHTEPEVVEKTEKITSYGYVVKNSGDTVLDASIKMAFKLFDAKKNIQSQGMDIEAAYEQMQVANKDLTETGKKLVESELRYKSLFQNLYNSFSLYEVIFDKNGNPCDYRILDVNPAYERTVGVKASSVIGKTLLELFPRTEPVWLEIMKRVVQTGTPELVEHYAVEVDKYIEQLVYIPQKGQMAFIASDVTERKKSEEALRISEELFSSQFELANIGLAITSPEKGWIKINKILCDIIGYSEEELKKKTWSELTHPDDLQSDVKQFEKVLSGEIDTYDLDKRFIRKDGSTIFTHLTVGCVRNPDKTVGYMIASIEDIAERKLVEEALKSTYKQQQQYLDLIHVMLVELDSTGTITLINRRGCEILGHDESELIGQDWFEMCLPGEMKDEVKGVFHTLMKGEIEPVEYYENSVITKDGKYKTISFHNTVIKDDTSRIKGILFSGDDITERKQTEDELRRSEALLNETQFLSSIGGWDYDAASGLSWWTEEVFHIHELPYDRSSKDVKLKVAESIKCYNPDDRPVLLECFRQLIEEGKPYDNEWQFTTYKGNRKWVRNVATPIKEGGKIIRVIGSIMDITQRKKAEEELKEALQENKDLLSELQHRVKNSFAMIVSMINLAAKASASNETRTALSEAGSRVRAVSEMYDLLYRTDSITAVQLHKYLIRVASSLPDISGNITLKKKCDHVTVPVKTAVPVGIIIAELITNSIKYAFPDNKSGTISLSLKKNKASTVIVVKDDGVGLPEGFDLSEVNSLGLKLVYALVDQIDGSFKITEDNGTSCILEFPIN